LNDRKIGRFNHSITHSLNHSTLLLLFEVLERIDKIQVHPIEPGGEDLLQVGVSIPDDKVLPFQLPVANLVVAAPLRVLFCKPYRRDCIPAFLSVVAVILCLADAHVTDDEAGAAVLFDLQRIDLVVGQRGVIEEKIYENKIVVRPSNSIEQCLSCGEPSGIDQVEEVLRFVEGMDILRVDVVRGRWIRGDRIETSSLGRKRDWGQVLQSSTRNWQILLARVSSITD